MKKIILFIISILTILIISFITIQSCSKTIILNEVETYIETKTDSSYCDSTQIVNNPSDSLHPITFDPIITDWKIIIID